MVVMGSGWLHRALSVRARRVQRERERERKGERERDRRECDEWIHGGVLGVMIDCFLVLWWTSGVAGSVCGRVWECVLWRAVYGA